jgi:hypothetical protein
MPFTSMNISNLNITGSVIADASFNGNVAIVGNLQSTQANLVVVNRNTTGNINLTAGTSGGNINLTTSTSGNVYISNYLGIGNTTPQAPLDVIAGTNKNVNAATSYYFTSATSSLTTGGNLLSNFSIYARGSILTIGSVVAATSGSFSDERIKTNIVDISNINTLELLKDIVPVKYSYIDKLNHSSNETFGFVAQQVENVIPEAVHKMDGYVPNIYEIADVSGFMITLKNSSTSQFNIDLSQNNLDASGNSISPFIAPTDVCGNPVLLKLYDKDNNEVNTPIGTIIDDKNFMVDDIFDSSNVFVYGQQVQDFRVIDKDVIYSLTTAAVKSLYEKVQTLEQIVATQQTQINQLLARLP